MTIENARQQAEALKARLDGAFSAADKQTIRRLYYEVMGRSLRQTSCQRCYHDAVIEVCLRLRNMKNMEKRSRYRMRAGFVISCPTFHKGKIFTNDNITDEIAEEYIEKFPMKAAMFDEVMPKEVKPEAEKVEEVENFASDGEKGYEPKSVLPTEKKGGKRKKSKK